MRNEIMSLTFDSMDFLAFDGRADVYSQFSEF